MIVLALEQALDSTDATEGEPVLARLAEDVKTKREMLARKGDLVRGRIRRLENYDQPRPHIVVGLEFSEIETRDKILLFQGALQEMGVPGVTLLFAEWRTTWRIVQSRADVFVDHAGTVPGKSG